MTRENLLRSKEFWTLQIQTDLFQVIEDYMEKNGLNRTDLAKIYNVSKGYITQVLNGDFDHKISKLVDLSLKAGKAPIIHFVNLDKYIQDDKLNKEHIYKSNFTPVQYTYDTNPVTSLVYNSSLNNVSIVSVDDFEETLMNAFRVALSTDISQWVQPVNGNELITANQKEVG